MQQKLWHGVFQNVGPPFSCLHVLLDPASWPRQLVGCKTAYLRLLEAKSNLYQQFGLFGHEEGFTDLGGACCRWSMKLATAAAWCVSDTPAAFSGSRLLHRVSPLRRLAPSHSRLGARRAESACRAAWWQLLWIRLKWLTAIQACAGST